MKKIITINNLTTFQILKQFAPYLIISNLLMTIFPLIINYYQFFFHKNNYQNQLYFSKHHFLDHLLGFDASHFLFNKYQWQINYAFLPGFVAIRQFYRIILQYLFGQDIKISLIIILAITNKIMTAFATSQIYKVIYIFSNNIKIAKVAALVFIFNPVSIFYHVLYSEPLYAVLTMTAIRLYYQNQKQSQKTIQNPIKYVRLNFLSLFLFTLASSVRTTTMFLSLIYGIPILKNLWKQLIQKQITKIIKVCFTGFLVLIFFIIFFIIYNYYGYISFCRETQIQIPRFCFNKIPNLYAYIEQQFWNVGFLSFYKPQFAFQLAMGFFSVLVCIITIQNSIRYLPGLTIAYYLLIFVTIGYTVLQSSGRFFSSHTMYIYYVAQYLTNNKNSLFLRRLVIFYLVCYNVLGIFLFTVRCSWI